MGTSIRNLFGSKLIVPLLLAWGVIASCSRDETATPAEGMVTVPVEIGDPATRTFTDGTHRVDRILILPFRKTSENLANDNANFVPAYSFAKQMDVSQFPVNSASINLPTGVTFKVLVIGYNRTDFDFNSRTSPANRFDIGTVATPATLANFTLVPKSPAIVPEFFTGLATAYNGVSPQGNAFRPEQNYTLQTTLWRVVSGFSVTITGVPDFVKSITLRAENLVKVSLALDASAYQWQTAGDGGDRILGKKVPSLGTVAFDYYLLPTYDAHKTGFFLDVELGSTSQTYTVATSDQAGIVSGNKFIFKPNEATNLLGTYSQIGFGFKICYGINLDDPQWDGYH